MRKTHIFRGRKEQPGLTRLKRDLTTEQQQQAYEWATKEHQDEARSRILREFGIRINSNSTLSAFVQWYFGQQQLDGANKLVEQFEEFYRKANPNASREKIREAGIAFFMAESLNSGDKGTFARFADLSMKEDSGRTKARHKEKSLALEERRVELLEIDVAKACLEHLRTLRQIASDSRMDQNAKINAVRRRLFGALPEETSTGQGKTSIGQGK